MGTGIEWTDETWNPVVGCKAVSPGCDNCYAARDASGRLSDVPVYRGLARGGVFTGEVRELPGRLDKPLRWRRPRRVFVNSMSDLFHPDVSDLFIAEVFAVMGLADVHTFQVLTKRPKAMAGVLDDTEWRYKERLGRRRWQSFAAGSSASHNAGQILAPTPPYPNIWLGTSIESDRYTFRANHLRDTPAAVRFLSCEPLLGPLPSLDLSGIDWVIVGGESGPHARPMHPDWARELRDRCQLAGVAFLFKQWGEYGPSYTRRLVVGDEAWPVWRHGRKAAGRELDGRTWDGYPA